MKQPNGTETPDTPFAPYETKGVEGYPTFLPAQPQAIGSLLPADKFPQNAKPSKLFEPIEFRGVTFPNRAWVAPMCMYSSDNGHATDHHFVHLGSMAMRGWGNIMVEATAVVPEGRISEHDAGLWQDSQIAPLKRIVQYVQALGSKIGIQLAHAGRKASTIPPFTEAIARDQGWKGGSTTPKEYGGWHDNVYGASEGSFHPGFYPDPIAASEQYIENYKKEWLKAVERCKEIGFDYIEIHGAHGYLIHEFLSPLTNQRTDKYGGSLENRLRLPLELAELTRKNWDKPLFFRVSASDWLDEDLGPEVNPNGEYQWWGINQTTILAEKLRDAGIDLLDVSSGGNDLRGHIKVGPSYQVQFAEHIKKNVSGLPIGAVGIITEPEQANDIIETGKADVTLFARQVLRDIDFPLRAAMELGVAVNPSLQYGAAWSRMLVPRKLDEVHHQANGHGTQRGESEVEGEESHKREGGRGSKAPPQVFSSVP